MKANKKKDHFSWIATILHSYYIISNITLREFANDACQTLKKYSLLSTIRNPKCWIVASILLLVDIQTHADVDRPASSNVRKIWHYFRFFLYKIDLLVSLAIAFYPYLELGWTYITFEMQNKLCKINMMDPMESNGEGICLFVMHK